MRTALPNPASRAPLAALAALAAIAAEAACARPHAPPPVEPPKAAEPAPTAAQAAPSAPPFGQIPRLDFNRIAVELDLPLFWIADRNGSGAVEPDEVAALWHHTKAPAWVAAGAFTPEFTSAYAAMLKIKAEGHPRAGLDEAEQRRRDAVLAELAAGRPSLLRSDFRGASAEDRAIVGHLLKVAELIDQIHAKQLGSAGMADAIPADDPASRALFWRNQGPWCEQPKTRNDPNCSALPSKPPRVTGAYPARIQQDKKFCAALEARRDQQALLSPFTLVVEEGGALKAVPYSEAYKPEMEAVSRELKAAAEAIQSPTEAAFKAYLLAASQAFLDNRWELADEPWSKMNAESSAWYLRVGPDETYWEPCSRKAGFHVSFARINQESLAWQKKLDPAKADMEAAFAKLAGAPYKERKVAFHLPDFIDIVVNAGDSRAATGGTAGQSLPNWGRVATEGRGRTVAMVNLFDDDDSRAALREAAASLLCKATMESVSLERPVATLGTVLHEAAHNLGPTQNYKVKGKTDNEIFGGPLATMLEEFKAQTGALFFTGWLAERGVIDPALARMAETREVIWALGQVGQGMYTAGGEPRPYGQLAAIQLGSLLDAGALGFYRGEVAANGADKGCFSIQADKLPAAAEALARTVLGIKARGDKAAAQRLRDDYVEKEGAWKALRGVIEERMQRMPLGSAVYAIEL
ncbi:MULTISPECIES: hypothetical protein [Sorangium]|uniref:EF-hand domain-containing protein n=1 Tax=Sorangium cellulosum TaxID=56 RepID=A0A4P2QT35_SORCE|nr:MULTISPECIES: hypothetical protein [Sorangium]AUX32723.1 hypothetical protein SOCE836_048700 [Sorangium cellulosum]WCQ92100.1 hypothetical protein NQZ70_04830 [Sorangium sp. Soce836]